MDAVTNGIKKLQQSDKEIQPEIGLQGYYNKYFEKVKSFLKNTAKTEHFGCLCIKYYVNSLLFSLCSYAVYTQDVGDLLSYFGNMWKKLSIERKLRVTGIMVNRFCNFFLGIHSTKAKKHPLAKAFVLHFGPRIDNL